MELTLKYYHDYLNNINEWSVKDFKENLLKNFRNIIGFKFKLVSIIVSPIEIDSLTIKVELAKYPLSAVNLVQGVETLKVNY